VRSQTISGNGDTIITEEVRKFPTRKWKEIGIERCERLRRDEVLRIRKRCADNR
jgi:hypothetical protein